VCGIVGVAFRDQERPVSPALVREMCTAIRHRGPDDEGMFINGSIGLGMRRLSIIDLAGGHQPIFNEDRTKVIVLNGEIYNYRELRRGLIARGHHFQSQGDTETVLHLYEELGPACVRELRGMFAFAIWDASARRLLLARDRFGIKPLYVTTGRGGIAFASELKALHAAGLTRRELDWEALDIYFQLGYIPAPASPFHDTRKVAPGETLVWQPDGALVSQRYWDLPRDPAPCPADVEQRVCEWLDESVSAHLVSDVSVAAFLSGGLDSSAVVASMALLGETPRAFTARYTGTGADSADETAAAAELASRYRAAHTIVDIGPDVCDAFERIVWALDEPHADDSSIPTWALSQVVGSQYKVALTGIGGDELFAGYRRHIGLLAGQYYARLPRPLQRVLGGAAHLLREPAGGGLRIDRLKRFLDSGDETAPDRFLGYLSRLRNGDRRALYTDELRAVISGRAALSHFERVYREGGAPEGLAAALYLDYKTYLADDILALSDRLAMAHSLEIRVPFVDHLFVERVFRLPARVKVGLFERKRLLKRALRSRLPPSHFKAPKRGFVGPTSSWLRHELRPMLEDELSADRVRRIGYLQPAKVRRLLDEHFSGRHNREGILWALLCFSNWHHAYVEAPHTAPSPLAV
jgi:asparagine synthase (glutamine-hydrolysing)